MLHALLIGFVALRTEILMQGYYEANIVLVFLAGVGALTAHIIIQTAGEELFDRILEEEETERCEDCGGIRLDE